jgi:hypothetical protein
MLTKLATFEGISKRGEPLVHLFTSGSSFEKTAGVLMPEISQWASSYTPEEDKIAVLVNAMGASEYWGQNVNGDIFPETALIHDCGNHKDSHPIDDFTHKTIPPYGYKTFLQALPFVHHRNKDPNRAFGKVVMSCWNPKMHRVELIVVLDKRAALQNGAQSVIDRILAGEFPDVSMGCKVPYDICAVCGHKSKTRDDYCACIRHIGMGKILDDGRRIGVINTYPRFFDISFVFIGADKTAKMMCKLSSAGLYLPQSLLDADEIYKTACGTKDCRDCIGGCKVKAAGILGNAATSGLAGGALGALTGAAISSNDQRGHGALAGGIAGATAGAGFNAGWGLRTKQVLNKIEAAKKEYGRLNDLVDASFRNYDKVVDKTNVLRKLRDSHIPTTAGSPIDILKAREKMRAVQFDIDHLKDIRDSIAKQRSNFMGLRHSAGDAVKWDDLPSKEVGTAAGALSGIPAGFAGQRFTSGSTQDLDKNATVPVGAILQSELAQAEAAKTLPEPMKPAARLLRRIRQAVSDVVIGPDKSKAAAVEPFEEGKVTPATTEFKVTDDARKNVFKRFPEMAESDTLLLGRADDQESAPAVTDGVLSSNLDGTVEKTKQADEPDEMIRSGIIGGLSTAAGEGLMAFLQNSRKFDKSVLNTIGRTGVIGAVGGLTAASLNRAMKKTHHHHQHHEKLSSEQPSFAGLKALMRAVGAPIEQYDLEQVSLGFPVEMEHANTGKSYTSAVTGGRHDVWLKVIKIVLAHLDEIPDYYTRLKKMEEGATKKASVNIEPPPSPNREKHPFVGTIHFKGFTIYVENLPGTMREGVNKKTGKKWSSKMYFPYGEFSKTKGMDGDKLDVFVGPNESAENVHIVHQNKEDGTYDEDKVMLGFKTPEEAKAAYLVHYDSPKYFRSITTMAFSLFKKAMLGGEMDNQKVAMKDVLEKVAADMQLEDLFNSASTPNSRRRERTWRDKSTGKEVTVIGPDMSKMASAVQVPSALQLLKIGEDKLADLAKWSDIVKEIGPEKAVGKVSPLVSKSEEELPKGVLHELGKHDSLESALTTPSLMGMVLKPEEFQRIILEHMGHDDLADKLEEAGATFKPTEGETAPCKPLDSKQLDPELLKQLLPFLEDKSYFGPVIRRRIIRISIMGPKEHEKSTEVNSPLLSKVSSAYNWYRREQMKLAADAMTVVPEIPELHAGIYRLDDHGIFKGAAGSWVNASNDIMSTLKGASPKTLAIIIGSVPLALMYSAHLRGEKQDGKDLGPLRTLLANHPWLTSAGLAVSLKKIMSTPQGQQAADELFSAAQRVWYGKNGPEVTGLVNKARA